MIRFQQRYFALALQLFLAEVVIAVFIDDQFIRPYLGDFLVDIFLYCLVRSFFKARIMTVLTGVLLFSYLVEALQYFQLVQLLGLSEVGVAKVVLGTSFEWADLVAYTLGAFCVIFGELKLRKVSAV